MVKTVSTLYEATTDNQTIKMFGSFPLTLTHRNFLSKYLSGMIFEKYFILLYTGTRAVLNFHAIVLNLQRTLKRVEM